MAKMRSARHMIDEVLMDFINTLSKPLDPEKEGKAGAEWTDRLIEVTSLWAGSDYVHWMVANLHYVMLATSFLLCVCWIVIHQSKAWRQRRAMQTTENGKTSQTSKSEVNTDKSQETEPVGVISSAWDEIPSKLDTSKPAPERPINSSVEPHRTKQSQEARASQRTGHLPSSRPVPLPTTKLTTPAYVTEDVKLKGSVKRMDKQRYPMSSNKLLRLMSGQISDCDTNVEKTPRTTTQVKQKRIKEKLRFEKSREPMNTIPVDKAVASNIPAQHKRSDSKPEPSNKGIAMATKNTSKPNVAKLCTDKPNKDKAIPHTKDQWARRPASDTPTTKSQEQKSEETLIDKFHDITYLAANKNVKEKSKVLQTFVSRPEDNKRASPNLSHKPLLGAGDSNGPVKEWTPRTRAKDREREQSHVLSERKLAFRKKQATEGRRDHSGNIITKDVTPRRWPSEHSNVICIKCQIPSDTLFDTTYTGGVSSCCGCIDGRYDWRDPLGVAVPVLPHSALSGYAWDYACALCRPISPQGNCQCPNCLASACNTMAKDYIYKTNYTPDREIPHTCSCAMSRERSLVNTDSWRGNNSAMLASEDTESETDLQQLPVHVHHSQDSQSVECMCKPTDTEKSEQLDNQETNSRLVNTKKTQSEFLMADGQRVFKRSKREHRRTSRTSRCPLLADCPISCDGKKIVSSCHCIECLARENQKEYRRRQCQVLHGVPRRLSRVVMDRMKPSLKQTGDSQLIKAGLMTDSRRGPKASVKTTCLTTDHTAKVSGRTIHHHSPLLCMSFPSHQNITHLKAVKTLKSAKMRQEQNSRHLQSRISRGIPDMLLWPREDTGQPFLIPRHPEVKDDKCAGARCRLTLPSQKDPAMEEGLSHTSSNSISTSSFLFSGFSSELSALCMDLFKCPYPRSGRRLAENETAVQGDSAMGHLNTFTESIKHSLPGKHPEDIKGSYPESRGESMKPSLPVSGDRVMRRSFQLKPTELSKCPLSKDHSESVQQPVTTRRRDFRLAMSTNRDHNQPQEIDGISETCRWGWHKEHCLTHTTTTGSQQDDMLETPPYALKTLQWLEETIKTASLGQEQAPANTESHMVSSPFKRTERICHGHEDTDATRLNTLLNVNSLEPNRSPAPALWHKRKGESVEKDIRSSVLVEFRKHKVVTRTAGKQIQTFPEEESLPTPTPIALKLRDYLMESSKKVHCFYRHSSDQTSPMGAIRPKLNIPKFQPYTSRAEAKRSKRDTGRENLDDLSPPRAVKSLLKAELNARVSSPQERPRVTARWTNPGIQGSFLFDNSREEKIIIFSESSFHLAEAEDIFNTPDPQDLVVGEDDFRDNSEKSCQVSLGGSLSMSKQDAAVKQTMSVFNSHQQIADQSNLMPDKAEQIRIRKLSRYCQNSYPSMDEARARPEVNWSTETLCTSITSSVNADEIITLPHYVTGSSPKLRHEGDTIHHFPTSSKDKGENHDEITGSLTPCGENVNDGLTKFGKLVPNAFFRRDISDRRATKNTQLQCDQNFINKSACTDKANGQKRKRSRIPRYIKTRRSENSLKKRLLVNVQRGTTARTISMIKEIEPYCSATTEVQQDLHIDGPTAKKSKIEETAVKEETTQTSLSEKGRPTQPETAEPQPAEHEPKRTWAGDGGQTRASSTQYGYTSPQVFTQQLYHGLNEVLLQVLGHPGEPNIIIITPDKSKRGPEKNTEAFNTQISPARQRFSPLSSDSSPRHRSRSNTSPMDLYSTSLNRTRISTDTSACSPASLRPATNDRLETLVTDWLRTRRKISLEQFEVGKKKPSRIPQLVSTSLDRGEIRANVRTRGENRGRKGKMSSFRPRVVTDGSNSLNSSPPPSIRLSDKSNFDQRVTTRKMEQRIRSRSGEWKEYYKHSSRKRSVDTTTAKTPTSYATNKRKKGRDINQVVLGSKARPSPSRSPARPSNVIVRSKSSLNTPNNTRKSKSPLHTRNVMPSSKIPLFTKKLTPRSKPPSYLDNVRPRSKLPLRSANVTPKQKKVKNIFPLAASPGAPKPPSKRLVLQATEENVTVEILTPKKETVIKRLSSLRKKLDSDNNMDRKDITVARTSGASKSGTRIAKVSQTNSSGPEYHKTGHYFTSLNCESQQWRRLLNPDQSLNSLESCDHYQQRTSSFGNAQNLVDEVPSHGSSSPDLVRSLSPTTVPSEEVKAAVCRQVTLPPLKAKHSCSHESSGQELANVPRSQQSQDNKENNFHKPSQVNVLKPTDSDIALQTRKRDRKTDRSQRKQNGGISAVEGISADPKQPHIPKVSMSLSRPSQNKQNVTTVNVQTYHDKTENFEVSETALDLTSAKDRGVRKGRVRNKKQGKRPKEPSLDPIARAAMRQAAAPGRAAMDIRAPADLGPNSPSPQAITVKNSHRHVTSAQMPAASKEQAAAMEDPETRKDVHGNGTNKSPMVNSSHKVDRSSPRKHHVAPRSKLYQKQTIASLQRMKRNSNNLSTKTKARAFNSQRQGEKRESWQEDTTYVKESAVKDKLIRKARVPSRISQISGSYVDKSKHNGVYLTNSKTKTNARSGKDRAETEQTGRTALGSHKLIETQIGRRKLVRKIRETSQAIQPVHSDYAGHAKGMQENPSSPQKESQEIKVTSNSIKQHPQPPSLVSLGRPLRPRDESRKRELMHYDASLDGISSSDADRYRLPDRLPGKIKDREDESISSDLFGLFPMKAPPGWMKSEVEKSPDDRGSMFSLNHFSALEEDQGSLASPSNKTTHINKSRTVINLQLSDGHGLQGNVQPQVLPPHWECRSKLAGIPDDQTEEATLEEAERPTHVQGLNFTSVFKNVNRDKCAAQIPQNRNIPVDLHQSSLRARGDKFGTHKMDTTFSERNTATNKESVTRSPSGVQGLAWSSPTGSDVNAKRSKSSPAVFLSGTSMTDDVALDEGHQSWDHMPIETPHVRGQLKSGEEHSRNTISEQSVVPSPDESGNRLSLQTPMEICARVERERMRNSRSDVRSDQSEIAKRCTGKQRRDIPHSNVQPRFSSQDTSTSPGKSTSPLHSGGHHLLFPPTTSTYSDSNPLPVKLINASSAVHPKARRYAHETLKQSTEQRQGYQMEESTHSQRLVSTTGHSEREANSQAMFRIIKDESRYRPGSSEAGNTWLGYLQKSRTETSSAFTYTEDTQRAATLEADPLPLSTMWGYQDEAASLFMRGTCSDPVRRDRIRPTAHPSKRPFSSISP